LESLVFPTPAPPVADAEAAPALLEAPAAPADDVAADYINDVIVK